MSIGDNIKRIRLKKNLTQKKLGLLSGMSESQIGQYETGKRNPKKDTLDKIAKALDVDVSALFGIDILFQERRQLANEDAKARKIDVIIKNLENIGCSVIHSNLQDDELPPNTSAIYLYDTSKFIVVSDKELIEFEKNINEFLKFKFNELVNTKEVRQQKFMHIKNHWTEKQ